MKLFCEYLTDPVGIDKPAPRLSWEGVRQDIHRICAATTLEKAEHTIFEKEAALSRVLARLNLSFASDMMDMKVEWCRTAYDKHENWNYRYHSHNFYELHFCQTGQCCFLLDNSEEVYLDTGQLLLINRNTAHELLRTSPDFSKLVMGFDIIFHTAGTDAAVLARAFSEFGKFIVSHGTEEMAQLVSSILAEVELNQVGLVRCICMDLERFIVQIGRVLRPNHVGYKAVKTDENDRRFAQVEQYVKENLSARIYSADVAQHINLGEKQLARIVKRETGCSVPAFIEKHKIEHAKHLLVNSALSVKDISGHLAYSNEYNFSRAFKRSEGMSPSQYRKSVFTKSENVPK